MAGAAGRQSRRRAWGGVPGKPRRRASDIRSIIIICAVGASLALGGSGSAKPRLRCHAAKHTCDVWARQRQRRAVVVRRLNRGFLSPHARRVCGYDCPMVGTGRELERAGWRYHVSPYVIAGIAATESSLGAAACTNNRYNAFGLASCGSGWSVPAFATWGDAYMFEARFLREHWPRALTPYDLGGYAACTACWASHVTWHTQAMFNVSASLTYPGGSQ